MEAHDCMFIILRIPLAILINYSPMMLPSYSILKKLVIIPNVALGLDWGILVYLKICNCLKILGPNPTEDQAQSNKSKVNKDQDKPVLKFKIFGEIAKCVYKFLSNSKNNKYFNIFKFSILFVVPLVLSIASSLPNISG